MNRRWKLLIALGVFLVLLAASLTLTMHTQPASELETYKNSLRAKGEKLELSEVLPPLAAPEDNSADVVKRAFGMFSDNHDYPYAMRMAAPGKAMIGWMQPDVHGLEFTNSWDEFATKVAMDQPALELLHQVLERPKLDFQLDYNKVLPLPQLQPMMQAARKLTDAAVLNLHNGNSGAAATDILTLLALVHKDTRDDLNVMHLVRLTMTDYAISATWELLQATNVTGAQLADMQNGWQQLTFLSDAEKAGVLTRAFRPAGIEKSRASHDGFNQLYALRTPGSSPGGSGTWQDMVEGLAEGTRLAVAESMWRSSWSYAYELYMLKCDEILIETLRMMQTNRSQFYKADYDAMSTRLSSLGPAITDQSVFKALMRPRLGAFSRVDTLLRTVGSTLQTETARRIVITAIALKRFQLKHGRWPETLDQLAPEFIPSVPIDPYDGKPLKYHPNADGTYLLYSVGEDGVDNGGDPSSAVGGGSNIDWLDSIARDWVWPQPATPAEVKYFHEHPPK